jgi:hypothetical protein
MKRGQHAARLARGATRANGGAPRRGPGRGR